MPPFPVRETAKPPPPPDYRPEKLTAFFGACLILAGIIGAIFIH